MNEPTPNEIDSIEAALRMGVMPLPRPALKSQIMATLANLAREEAINLTDPPLVNRHSDAAKWNAATASIEPNRDFDAGRMKIIYKSPERYLAIAWFERELVEPGHATDEFTESFLILEGSCTCDLDGQLVHLNTGDYFAIPAATKHTIQPTSRNPGYVKALVQRQRLAA